MLLSTIDWVIIGAYFVVSILIGVVLSKRAGSNTTISFSADENCRGGLPVRVWSQRLLPPLRRWP
jgi:hypothetical protein